MRLKYIISYSKLIKNAYHKGLQKEVKENEMNYNKSLNSSALRETDIPGEINRNCVGGRPETAVALFQRMMFKTSLLEGKRTTWLSFRQTYRNIML